MLLNYLKVALRNYWKNKLYASLNILGLAIGYTAAILIGIYLHDETSFEDFHSKADRIFRPTQHDASASGFDVHWARLHIDYINELPNDMPEVEHLIRFQNHERTYIRIGEDKFRPTHSYVTDPEVFDVFDFKLVAGDPNTALVEPYSIVLTESLARKYFGEEDPMGKELFVIGQYNDTALSHKITGVMADLPSNTHLPVEMLISFKGEGERSWWAYIYVLLKEGADITSVEDKMPDFIAKYTEGNQARSVSIEFQALKEIHLTSHLAREIIPNGDLRYVRIFFFVGLFILLIAMINYLNLSSALSMARSREVGMRLILGAEKGQLIRFALVEAVIYNLLAAGLSLLIALGAMPAFQALTGAEMLLKTELLVVGIALVAILCGLLAGIYPAIVLASFSSLKMIRHSKSFNFSRSSSSFPLKRVLVGLQFCVATLLIGSAWIARNQLVFLQDKHLGMETAQVLAIPNVPNPVTDNYPTFRDRLSTIAGVQSVAACMEVPSREIRDVGPTLIQGRNQDPQQAPMLDIQVISPGFLETMGIGLLAGEDPSEDYIFGPVPQFSKSYSPKDYLDGQTRNYMINETAMRELGWQNPAEAIGQQISWSIGGFELAVGPITGVVEDVHQESLKNKVDPTIMLTEQIWLRTFLVKVEAQDIAQTLAKIQSTWNELYPAYPMEYHFVDELYDRLYKNERKQLQLLMILSGLAIFIAFLGLFSLLAYSLQTRVKEIAIRRVVGASLPDLIRLMSAEYLIVLIIGAFIAIPLSYYWVKDWLQNFAYSVDISWSTYAFTVGIIAALLLLTVSFQTVRSTSINPADRLREE